MFEGGIMLMTQLMKEMNQKIKMKLKKEKKANIKINRKAKTKIYWLNMLCSSYTGDTAGLENVNTLT